MIVKIFDNGHNLCISTPAGAVLFLQPCSARVTSYHAAWLDAGRPDEMYFDTKAGVPCLPMVTDQVAEEARLAQAQEGL